MKLSPEQKQAVAQWLGAGASIADVQKRLRTEFEVALTYIDTRFLIDDLGLELAAPPKPKETPADLAAKGPAAPAGAIDAEADLVDESDPYAEPADLDAPEDPAGAASQATVDVDRITRPGTVVSGTVTFSDGNSGKWALDQYGRLMFEGAKADYRPSQADLQAFQRELSTVLQRKGY